MFNRFKTALLFGLTMLLASSVFASIPRDPFSLQSHRVETAHPSENRVGGFQNHQDLVAVLLPVQDAQTHQVKWVLAVRRASDVPLNLYAYGNLNPLFFVDPYGLCAEQGGSIWDRADSWLSQNYANHLQSEYNSAQQTAAWYASDGYQEYSQSGAHKTAVFLQDMNEAIGTKLAVGAMAYSFATMPASISTPHGRAIQSSSPSSRSALRQIENGGTVYRQGNFGVQNTSDAQFWSLNNPASTPGYAGRMGMPAGSSAPDWMMGGSVRSGAAVITRPAPAGPGGVNLGGTIEGVVSPGGVQANWFHMP
jgi:hypothetical protein